MVIPAGEMVLDFPADMYGADYNEMILRHQKILNKMLGAEVDLMVKGIDAKSRTVVASRTRAEKREQIYYFGKDGDGQYRIYDGRVVEARVNRCGGAGRPGRSVWRGDIHPWLAIFRGTGSAMLMTAMLWETRLWYACWRLTAQSRSASELKPTSKAYPATARMTISRNAVFRANMPEGHPYP